MATRTTTADRVRLREVASRIPAAVKIAAFAGAIFVTELLLAASIVKDGRAALLMLMFIAAIALAAVFRFPMATALVFLGFTDFIFHAGFFPEAGVGPTTLSGYEFVLGCLLVVAVVRPRRRTWGGVAGIALAVFLGFVVLASIVGIASGRMVAGDAFNWGRSLGLLTIFYVVVRVFPDAEQRRTLLIGAVTLAAITGVVALAVALGSGIGDVIKGSGSQIVREEEGVGSIQRVRLAGLSAGYALFWYVVTQIIASRGAGRFGWSLALAGIAIDILVSFNRNMWSGLVLGLAMMMVFGGPLLRSRLVVGILVGAVGIALISAVSPSGQDRLIDPVVKRGATIINPSEVSSEGSYRDREAETRAAWATARDNPLFGVGAGAPFGVWVEQSIAPNSFIRGPQLFLHNQYLYLLLVGGVPALLAFLVFLCAPIVQALRRRPHDLPIVACAVGIVSIMISAAVAIYFTVPDMAVMLGLLAGVIVADAGGPAGADETSGLSG